MVAVFNIIAALVVLATYLRLRKQDIMHQTGRITGIDRLDALNFHEGMRVELDDGEPIGERRMQIRDRCKFFALGFSVGWVTLTLVAVCFLMLGCGGDAGDSDEPQEVELASTLFVSGGVQRSWCCEDTIQGKPALVCGVLHREPLYWLTCYCAGIVHGDTCESTQPYTPGTFCTSADLVCW